MAPSVATSDLSSVTIGDREDLEVLLDTVMRGIESEVMAVFPVLLRTIQIVLTVLIVLARALLFSSYIRLRSLQKCLQSLSEKEFDQECPNSAECSCTS